jgi:hypothetical protein
MRISVLTVSSFALAVGFGAACSSSSSNRAAPSDDGGAGGDDAGAPSITYAPSGCAYTVTSPESRGFTGQALDAPTAFADPTMAAPVRVRVGLGGGTTFGQAGYPDATTTAAFTWETTDTSVVAAQVQLGTSPTSLTTVQAGMSWTTPPPTVGVGTGEPAARMHEVHVCGLTPGTTYYYQVGGGPAASPVWSATQTFTTLPATGAMTIGVSGDSRDSSDIFQLVQLRMRDAAVAAQLFSGDFVLWGTQESLFATWLDAAWKDPNDATKFLTLGQQLMLPVAGNHENESSQYFGNFALPGDGAYAKTYGSVVLGSAHVLLLDDQQISENGSSAEAVAQLAWIDADLTAAEADRANHPFILVVHHRGELGTGTHSADSDVVAMRAALMPLWDAHHVDIVFNGHEHDYERSKPSTGPSTAPAPQSAPNAGTTYIVCGGAGADADPPGTAAIDYRAISVGFGAGTPYVGAYGLLQIDVHSLTWTAYGLKSSGGTVAGDDVVDTYTLMR